MEKLKYEYFLKTWGGFYNEQHKKIHKKEPGNYWFDTAEERASYVAELKKLSEELGAKVLMVDTTIEGYNTRIMTTLHRVIRDSQGEEHYSSYNMGYGWPIDMAKYHMEYKWRPGFNDYPLGEDYDYDSCEIVQEWVTGSDSQGYEF